MSDLSRLVSALRRRAYKLPSGPTIALGPPERRECVCVDCVRARQAHAARLAGPNADRTRSESKALPGWFA